MSVGGQSNAPQTPFSPNYRERRSVQPRGPGNAYTQRPGQQPNPQQPAQLQPAPRPKFGQPDQPPPGMELNPDYVDRFANGQAGTMDVRPTDNKFRPIQQPQPQTGGDIQYAGGTPGFYEAQLQAQQRQGGQGYGNQFGGDTQDIPRPVRPAGSFLGGPYDPAGGYFGGGFGGGYSTPFSDYGGGFGGGYSTPFSDYGGGFGGGYGGGYSSPYMSPSMMGGLASLFGGMQGGGFQGMFNPQSQAQAQMRAYQQNQQRQGGRGGFEGGDIGNTAFDSRRMEALIDRPQPQRKPNQPPPVDKGEDDFNQQMATLSPEERAKYHGTSEHRNSANTLETIRRTRQDPEWGRYYQNKSDDEIYAGMQLRAT